MMSAGGRHGPPNGRDFRSDRASESATQGVEQDVARFVDRIRRQRRERLPDGESRELPAERASMVAPNGHDEDRPRG